MQNISLIYPTGSAESKHLIIGSEEQKILLGDLLYDRELDIAEFMTDDVKTLEYRQEIFADMLAEPKITELIREILPILESINELYRIRDNSHETEGQIYSVKLIELYIEFINTLYAQTREFRHKVTSKSLLRFAEFVEETACSDEFVNLCRNTYKLSRDVSRVKSITVGLNLDASFTPCEFGVLALNDEYIYQNDFMDRLTGKGNEKPLSSICPLRITSKVLSKEEKRFAEMALGSAINRLLKNSIKDWEPAIKAFFRQKTKAFLPLIKELKFLLFGAQVLSQLKDKNLPLTMPRIKGKTEKAFRAKGLYNPVIAMVKDKTICNTIEFDENGRIFIITGPNSGGKTVFLSAVGICQIFAQLGFLVPSKFAEISPVDRIFVCFTSKSSSKSHGRLEEECIQIKGIFNTLTEYSLVLMDETFSGTGSFEGAHIAFDVLRGLAAYGCRAVFSTHMHELVSMICHINSSDKALSKVDTLTVDTDGGGNRTYKIIRTHPDGKSYAKSISDKYGLTFEAILKEMK